ncbi:MAG TPA: BtrH N-terminal domain-containing protein [Clostridia bacterium]|nr:BtrH N-terminal domain-containing protein [Clostridia bacterium]
MKKHTIENVPRYFEPNFHDCFHNVLSSLLRYKGLNTKLVMADYLSFMYERESGYIGLNYLDKPLNTILLTEEEMNTSLEYVFSPTTANYLDYNTVLNDSRYGDRVKILRFYDDDSERASLHLKDLIDRNEPTIIAVDLFYMHYHTAWQKEHGLHYVIVTGYDDEKGLIELFDKKLNIGSDFDGSLTTQEIMQARNSNNPHMDPLLGEYDRPLHNVWVEVKTDSFAISDSKSLNIIRKSCSRMYGQEIVLGNKCGLAELDRFRNDLIIKTESELNNQVLSLFRYYTTAFKTIARSRRRFRDFINELSPILPVDLITGVSGLLEDSSKCWELCSNISYKFAITKSRELVKSIFEKLGTAMECETKAVDRLYAFLTNHLM